MSVNQNGAGFPFLASTAAPSLSDGQVARASIDSSDGGLRVHLTNGASGGTSAIDESSFTEGVTAGTPGIGAFNDSLTAVSAGKLAVQRITAYRAGHVNLRNASGTEIGTLAAALRTDPTGATTQPVSGSVALNPTTTGGWSIFSNTALTSTVVAVKSSAAGQIGGWVFHNPSAATTFIQFFNVATAGAVTIGSTTPTFVFALAAGASANVEFANGIAFSSGIQVAATTTATGSTAPATALVAGVFYK